MSIRILYLNSKNIEMKKITFVFVVLIISYLPRVSAQIPNPSFETWSKDFLVPSAMNPNSGAGTSGWWDFNFLNSATFGSSPVTVFKDSVNPTAYLGNYCAKIVSKAMTKKSIDTLHSFGVEVPDTNGLIFSGYVDTRSGLVIKTGIPCNNAFKSFTFYFRYVPNGVDTCSCTVKMYHYNTVTHQRDQIGYGYFSTYHSITNWSPATVSISYDSTHVVPDTTLIMFSAASLFANPKVGDTMNIDTGSVVLGMKPVIGENTGVLVYPNPATTDITFKIAPYMNADKLLVYDLSGRLTETYTINGKPLTINTQSYISGIYLYELQSSDGTRLNTGKFSVLNR